MNEYERISTKSKPTGEDEEEEDEEDGREVVQEQPGGLLKIATFHSADFMPKFQCGISMTLKATNSTLRWIFKTEHTEKRCMNGDSLGHSLPGKLAEPASFSENQRPLPKMVLTENVDKKMAVSSSHISST